MMFNVEENIPEIKPEDWRLQINGQVDNPLDLSLRMLKEDFEAHQIQSNILCLRGVTIKGLWTGVTLSDLLSEAEVEADAEWIQTRAYSDYREPVTMKDLLREEAIVAYSLDGENIPVEQGGQLRLIVPDKYAYKSVKWINELTVLKEKPEGFWEKKGYPDQDQGS